MDTSQQPAIRTLLGVAAKLNFELNKQKGLGQQYNKYNDYNDDDVPEVVVVTTGAEATGTIHPIQNAGQEEAVGETEAERTEQTGTADTQILLQDPAGCGAESPEESNGRKKAKKFCEKHNKKLRPKKRQRGSRTEAKRLKRQQRRERRMREEEERENGTHHEAAGK